MTTHPSKLLNSNLFDIFYNDFDSMFTNTKQSFPRYNIVSYENDEAVEFEITVALAGYKKEDIDVTFQADTVKSNRYNKLTISHEAKNKLSDSLNETGTVHVRGIANREFSISFAAHEHDEVKSCKMEDGLLKVVLERIKPKEENQEKKIEIM